MELYAVKLRFADEYVLIEQIVIIKRRITMKKLLAILLAAMMLVSVVACGKTTTTTTTAQTKGTGENATDTADEGLVLPNSDFPNITGKEYGKDYVSLYEKFGKEVTIADVEEDPDTGFVYITKDGKKYELGLDFLSMAMVYNTEVPEGDSTYETADDVYAAWWKYYITRWNALLPEVPLYSNEYYDVYNAKIVGPKDHPTNPYWQPADALIDWTSEKESGDFIIGNTTDLSGQFRFPSFGKTNPGAADNDIGILTQGLDTVAKNKEGGYEWNDTVVKTHNEIENEDGSKTFEIEIKDDLKFSDGSAITAKNYIVRVLTFSTPIAAKAANRDHQAGYTLVGYDTFKEANEPTPFAGVRLLGDYKFSVTVAADNLPYFYDITYAAFNPEYLPMWIGTADIKDDGEGAYLTEEFYKDATVDLIQATAKNTDTTYPYSGPYVVESYDVASKTATLKLNENFAGNYEGAKPSIKTVVYRKVVSDTQLQDLQSGGVDILMAVTGGDATKEAIAAADASNGAFDYIHYSRAGYGKLGFRADYGPVQFVAVRQAIAYCMDRAQFAKDFTGGYGGVADGPYYTGSWMYKAAKEQGMALNAYATSADTAIEALEAGGWIYDAEGNEYKEGVRYKKIAAEDITENDKNYQSVDGAYKTVEVNGDYYMPLVLNWYGTLDNEFTDLLQTGFKGAENFATAGFAIYNTNGDFAPMLDELYQEAVYGFYSGSPMYCVFNFATGFNSAVYDYYYNLSIEPYWFENNSAYYL